MKKTNGLLTASVATLLGIVITESAIAAPPALTPKQIKAAGVITSNRAIVTESIIPKSNDYSGEDELPIPEGVKPIKGMNIPLQMKEVKIYGLDHKPYGAAFLQQAIANAVKYHNGLKGAPVIKKAFKVKRVGKAYTVSLNTETYLAFIYAMAQEITKKYQSDQFLLTRAIVPEQTISQTAGSIEICVAEGYLAAEPTIALTPETKNPENFKRLLAPHLAKLQKMKPLNFEELERALLLIRDMPGVEIKTTFKQAKNNKANKKAPATSSVCERALANGAGSTLLEVRASANQFDGEASIDNYGTDSLGPEIMRFKVGANSKFKAGDRYALSIGKSTDAKETLNYRIDAQVPIGVDGLKAKAFYSNGKAEPAGFGSIGVNNKTQVLDASIEYPYIRSRKKNLSFAVGLRSHNVVTDSTAGVKLEDTKVNTLRLRATYDFSDKRNAVNLMSIGLVAGLSGSNGKNVVGAAAANHLNGNFVKLHGELARYQAIALSPKLTGNLTWINSLAWQYANEALFSSEEFSLGGREFGRGYDVASITGDQAIAVKTELQYKNKNKYGEYKAYSFVDHGRIKNKDKQIDPKDISQNLTSAGVGVEFDSNNNWFAKVELAKPIKITPDDENIDSKAKAYLQIGYRW